MKVNYIKTIGFRKFEKEFETKLYDVTSITGKNKSGKTNILFAIVNILFGTNLTGDEKPILINNKSDDSFGELHFTDNRGKEHVLIRRKNKYSSKENFIFLDGKPVTQDRLKSFYKDKKIFLTIINPMYFLNKKPADQKKIVDNCLSDVKPKVIFDMQDKEIQDMLIKKYCEDVNYYSLSDKEKEKFINTKMTNIYIDIAVSKVNKETDFNIGDVEYDIQKHLSELNEDFKNLHEQRNKLLTERDYVKNIASQEIEPYKEFANQSELEKLHQELSLLMSNSNFKELEAQKRLIQELEKNILVKEKEITELENEMQIEKSKYLSIKNNAVSICPVCNQSLNDENRNNIIKNMHNELISKYNHKMEMSGILENLKVNLLEEKCKLHSLEEKNTQNNEQNNIDKIIKLKQRIEKLQQEKAQVDRYNGMIDQKKKEVEKAGDRAGELFTLIDLNINEINDIGYEQLAYEKLYFKFLEEKMNVAKKYLKDVEVRFFSVLKTSGEMKDDFVITYKGKTLSDLSKSETVATALEFANMFNKISRINAPIFIDDYESCVDYDFISEYENNTQIIIAKVEKGKALEIKDYNENTVQLAQVA